MRSATKFSATVATLTMMIGMTSAEAQAQSRALSSAERVIVERTIKEMLVDPDSAQFEMRPFIMGSDLFCGQFNSKNRMGGYIGYKAFEVNVTTNASGTITSGSLPRHYGWGDEMSSAIMASAHCQEAGYDVPDPRGPGFN